MRGLVHTCTCPLGMRFLLPTPQNLKSHLPATPLVFQRTLKTWFFTQAFGKGEWHLWTVWLDGTFFVVAIVPVCFCYLDLIYSFLPLVFLVFKCFVNWSKHIHLINLLFMVISQPFSWNHNYFTCSFSCQNVGRVAVNYAIKLGANIGNLLL